MSTNSCTSETSQHVKQRLVSFWQDCLITVIGDLFIITVLMHAIAVYDFHFIYFLGPFCDRY